MGNLPEGAVEVQGTSGGKFIKLGKPGDFVTGTLDHVEERDDKYNPGKVQTLYVIRDVEQCESHKSEQDANGLWVPSKETDAAEKGSTAIVTKRGNLWQGMSVVEPGDRIHIEFVGKVLVENKKTKAKIQQGQFKVYKLPAVGAGNPV
jgi:hypothetical protein